MRVKGGVNPCLIPPVKAPVKGGVNTLWYMIYKIRIRFKRKIKRGSRGDYWWSRIDWCTAIAECQVGVMGV